MASSSSVPSSAMPNKARDQPQPLGSGRGLRRRPLGSGSEGSGMAGHHFLTTAVLLEA